MKATPSKPCPHHISISPRVTASAPSPPRPAASMLPMNSPDELSGSVARRKPSATKPAITVTSSNTSIARKPLRSPPLIRRSSPLRRRTRKNTTPSSIARPASSRPQRISTVPIQPEYTSTPTKLSAKSAWPRMATTAPPSSSVCARPAAGRFHRRSVSSARCTKVLALNERPNRSALSSAAGCSTRPCAMRRRCRRMPTTSAAKAPMSSSPRMKYAVSDGEDICLILFSAYVRALAHGDFSA